MATTVLKRNFSILIITAILLCFTCASVLADDGYPVSITHSVIPAVAQDGVAIDNPFALIIDLNFDDSFIEATEGIILLQFKIKFDSSKLQFIDPQTLEDVIFDDAGELVSGKPYAFGSIGNPTRFDVTLASDRSTLVCTYYSSTNVEHDIVQSGQLAIFGLKPFGDLSVDGFTDTTIKITETKVFGSNTEVPINVTPANDLHLKITSPVVAEVLGEPIVGGSVTVAGMQYIKDKSEPLTMYVLKDGYEVENGKDISLNSMFFNEVIHFDEDIYEGGAYKIVFAYKNTTQNIYIQVKNKQIDPDIIPVPTPSPTPEEDETDEPEEEDTPTESPTPTPSQKPTTTPKPSTGTVTNPAPTSTPEPSTTPSETPVEIPVETPEVTEEPHEPVEYPSDIGGHWGSENIKYVYENKLMNGYEDGTFAPDGNITRAEFAAVISRLLELEEAPEKALGFGDAENHWAKGYIGALSSRGIVSGVSETEFAPGANITREQIALILFRALELEKANTGDKYADGGDISSWAYDAVYSVYASGLMKGDTNGNFLPKASATRAEVATILYRLHSAKK